MIRTTNSMGCSQGYKYEHPLEVGLSFIEERKVIIGKIQILASREDVQVMG